MTKVRYLIFMLLLAGCEKGASDSATFASPSGQGGSLARFTIAGNYLYTVDKQDLKVYDISDAGAPVFKKTVPVGFEIETIYPFKDKLFIGSTSVVHIFSIADPASPQKLSVAISPDVLRRCDPVVAKDSVAFATLRTSGPCGGVGSILAVYDIKDITKPVQRAQVPVSEPYGLGYSENVLYVADRSALLVFDITRPYTPRLLRTITGISPIDVIPYNNVLVVWTRVGMNLYNIADRQNPLLLTQIN
jgi:hypothetical protein